MYHFILHLDVSFVLVAWSNSCSIARMQYCESTNCDSWNRLWIEKSFSLLLASYISQLLMYFCERIKRTWSTPELLRYHDLKTPMLLSVSYQGWEINISVAAFRTNLCGIKWKQICNACESGNSSQVPTRLREPQTRNWLRYCILCLMKEMLCINSSKNDTNCLS